MMEEVYRQSGYGRKINQQCSGLSFKTLMDLLHKKYLEVEKHSKKAKIQNRFPSYEAFLEEFFGQFSTLRPKMRQWDEQVLRLRHEVITLNSKSKPAKLKCITECLKEDPLIPEELLDQKLGKQNFTLSIYEKLFIQSSQYYLATQLYLNLKEKKKLSASQEKEQKELEEK